jgi:hyperosmotically inducible protein
MRYRHFVTIAIAMLATVPSSGCIWLAIGGAGATGYEIAKDDRSIGTKVDDATITSSVNAKFVSDGRVNAWNVNVDTYEAVVTLHGHVPSGAAAKRAIDLARSVKGVKQVRSKLAIVTP